MPKLQKKTKKKLNKGGRPSKFSSVKKINEIIDAYFDEMEAENRPPTFAGLAYYLGIDRKTLYNYSKENSKFFPTIKKARQKIEMFLEEMLITKGKPGQIFLAKNYGYTDKNESDNSPASNPTTVTTQPKKIEIIVTPSRKPPADVEI